MIIVNLKIKTFIHYLYGKCVLSTIDIVINSNNNIDVYIRYIYISDKSSTSYILNRILTYHKYFNCILYVINFLNKIINT